MTFNPGQTPAYVLPVDQSDYEEALVPSRSTTITQSVLVSKLNVLNQGTTPPPAKN